MSQHPAKREPTETISWNEVLGQRKGFFHHYQPLQHDQVGLFNAWKQKINSHGGYLDQTYAFLEPQSGLDWLDLATHTQYFGAWHEGFPAAWAAQAIKSQLKSVGRGEPEVLEVLALACGDARKDCQVVEALVELMPKVHGFLFDLLDVNSLLLDHALKYAHNLFRDEPRVKPISILGDMYQLNLYNEFFASGCPPATPRVVLLIGATIGSLTDEIAFLQHTLKSMEKGTLLLVDYTLVFGDPERPTELMEHEPYFSKNFPAKWLKAMERLYLGPFRRNKEGIREAVFRPALEMHRVHIPNSYRIELYADLLMEDGQKQSFGVQRIKRYQSESFINAVEATGWNAICGKRFATNREIYLFSKQ